MNNCATIAVMKSDEQAPTCFQNDENRLRGRNIQTFDFFSGQTGLLPLFITKKNSNVIIGEYLKRISSLNVQLFSVFGFKYDANCKHRQVLLNFKNLANSKSS